MSVAPTTIRVVIPLSLRKRNGRPRILPPAQTQPANDPGPDPHVVKAIARAWGWRRRLEAGEVATIADLAAAEGISDRYVGRMLRLAYLAPAVLKTLLVRRCPPAVSIKDLTMAADLPWAEQERVVFGG